MSDAERLDCEAVLRVIFAYLDGELGGADQVRVEAHLDRCRSCLARAEFERRLKERLTEASHQPVSPRFEQRIRALINDFADPEDQEPGRAAIRDV